MVRQGTLAILDLAVTCALPWQTPIKLVGSTSAATSICIFVILSFFFYLVTWVAECVSVVYGIENSA